MDDAELEAWAWIYTVKADVAIRMGHVDELLINCDRIIDVRRKLGHTVPMLVAAQNACEMLHQIGRDDLNTRFLPVLLDEARFAGHLGYTAYGYAALVRNIIATGSPLCIDVLLDAREWLLRCEDECAHLALEFAATSPIVRDRVASRVTAKQRVVEAR
jgi:hypothetical protein